jgi:hypothetical protein
VPTVITLALIPVIGATDRVEDIIFTLFFGSVIILFGAGAVVMFPFYKGIVWYIIGQPIASLLSYAMAVPTVVSTIVLGIAGIAAVGILCTLWRAGPTADPFLVSRMVVSLVLLAGNTRVFRADRTAVMVTGSPAALASALRTLDEQIAEMPSEDLREASSLSTLSILPLQFTASELEHEQVVKVVEGWL